MINRRFFVVGASLLLLGCNDDKPAPPPQPASPPRGGGAWRFINSPGMTVGEDGSFQFKPLPDSAHMLVHDTGALSGSVRAKFRIEGGPIAPLQGTRAQATLFFQRAGDNWSGQGEYVNYRWYGPSVELSAGSHVLEAPFTEGVWHNVYGKTDAAGFGAAMKGAAAIGFGFGDPGAGATAHGVHGQGKFILEEFTWH
jgi:hypothetical protein